LADARLHLAIATVAGSPMLIESVTRAQAALGELLAAIPVLRTNIAHSNDQHEAVVRAILAGDTRTARAAMEEHCDATAALLRGLIG
jgi:GntR family transcriptional repressor for pyruvate dehydrogenase complex